MSEEICCWKIASEYKKHYDKYTNHATECGKVFELKDHDFHFMGYNYCPNCGRKIQIKDNAEQAARSRERNKID